MPTQEEMHDALGEIEPGTALRLQLSDGREVRGTFAGEADGKITLDDVDPDQIVHGEEDGIALSDVERFSVSVTTEGPE